MPSQFSAATETDSDGLASAFYCILDRKSEHQDSIQNIFLNYPDYNGCSTNKTIAVTTGHSPLTFNICVTEATAHLNITYYNDPLIGRYGISVQAIDAFNAQNKLDIVAHVIAVRNAKNLSNPCILTSAEVGEISGIPNIVSIDEILSNYPRNGASLLDEALLNLSSIIHHPADAFYADQKLAPLVYCSDHDQMVAVLKMLEDQDLLKPTSAEGQETWPNGIIYTTGRYRIAAKGWQKIDSLRKPDIAQSHEAFVAMWFNGKTTETFSKGIEPAIKNTGIHPIRIDRKQHNNKICDEIIASIRKSRFLVADFTGHRGGVYYEAGFAHGLGIPVIWTCHKDHLKDLHFDTRQYNHILYTTPEELCEQLEMRIRATIPNLPK